MAGPELFHTICGVLRPADVFKVVLRCRVALGRLFYDRSDSVRRWVCCHKYSMWVVLLPGVGKVRANQSLTAVYIHGLGKDIWALPFDDITYMLIVSSSYSETGFNYSLV